MNFHEMLGLSYKKPVLNKNVKFFRHQGCDYAYLNQYPFKISFMEIGPQMVDMLNQFDGNRTVNEIRQQYRLDTDCYEFINTLLKNRILETRAITYTVLPESVLGFIFFPTSTCNLRCVYCYASAGQTPAINLDIKKAKLWVQHVFDNISPDIKKVTLTFHGGGEPTNNPGLLKELTELVQNKCIVSNLPLAISCTTNGNFNDEVFNWIAENKVKVSFSIDGGREAQDYLRPRADGKSSFNVAYNNLKRTADLGLFGGIRATVTNVNKNSLKELIDISVECGSKSITIEKLSEFGREHDFDKTYISNTQFIESFMDMWKYACEKNVQITGFSGSVLSQSREYFCINYEKPLYYLTPEGYLSTCLEVSLASDPASEVFFVGKVNDDSSVVYYEDKIKSLKERKSEIIPQCQNCFLEHVCRAGCPVLSYRKNNKLNSIHEDNCEYIQELSVQILKSILNNPDKFNAESEFNRRSFAAELDNEIRARMVSFNPF